MIPPSPAGLGRRAVGFGWEQPIRAVAVPVEQVHATRRRGTVGGLAVLEHVEVLHRHRHRLAAGRSERPGAAHARPVFVVERARHLLQRVRLLGVGRRDDVAVLVLRDREQPVHLLDLRAGHPDRAGDALVALVVEVDAAHVGAHGGETPESMIDGCDVAGGEQLGQVADRDAELVDRREQRARVFAVVAGARDDIDDGRERRDVPDHRHRAVLRVQRECDLVLHQLPDRAALSRLDPVLGDVALPGGLDDGRVVRVEDDLALRLQELLVVLDAGRCGDAIGVVEDQAEVAQPPDAGLGAHGRQARPRCAGSTSCTSRPCRSCG